MREVKITVKEARYKIVADFKKGIMAADTAFSLLKELRALKSDKVITVGLG